MAGRLPALDLRQPAARLAGADRPSQDLVVLFAVMFVCLAVVMFVC